MSEPNERHVLGAVVLVALVLRLGLAVPRLDDVEKAFFRPDAWSYFWPAQSLLERGGYHPTPTSTEPATLRPPGFPALLALLLAATGGSLPAVVVVLCVLSALTCVPVYRTARLLGGRRAATAAALLVAFHITSLAAAPMILSDSFAMLLAAWQLLFLARFGVEGRSGDLAWSALLTGVGALVRTSAFFAILPWALLAALGPHRSARRRGACVAGGLALFALCVVPWMLRNRAVGAGFAMDTAFAVRYDTMGAALAAAATDEPAAAIRERWEREDAARPGGFPDEAARIAHKRARFLAQARAHPWILAQYYLAPRSLLPDVATFLEHWNVTRGGRGTVDVLQRRGAWAAAAHYLQGRWWLLVPLAPLLAAAAATCVGCLVQAIRWARARSAFWLVAFAGFVVAPLMMPGPLVEPRYQLAALPLMAVMAGLGLRRG